MPGYKICEERYLHIYKQDGIAPNGIKIGLLDFLRELRGGAEGIPHRRAQGRFAGICHHEFLADVLHCLGRDREQWHQRMAGGA